MAVIQRTKSFIKATFPGSAGIYRRVRGIRRALNLPDPGMEEIFSRIYQHNSWADAESVSGRGSSLARTGVIRSNLPTLLESVRAKSLLDAACGDFNWMGNVDLSGFDYLGSDIVPELIARNRRLHGSSSKDFVVLDITRNQLPQVDVILCRDCFIHLSFKEIQAAIGNFKRSNSRFLFATTHTTVRENTDIETGEWRSVNLQLRPFNFPQPTQLIIEDHELGKCLGVWRLEQL